MQFKPSIKLTFGLLLCTLATFQLPLFAQESTTTPWPASLITTPEKTNYQETSTYADVMAFVDALKAEVPNKISVFELGKTLEGKSLPLVVFSDRTFSSAQEIKQSDKFRLYIKANIHSGEVEGKEASMMLMRELLLGSKSSLLENQIILFCPIYNADSNDKMEAGIRPSQEDSPVKVGLRANSQGLDLNRDGIKAEANETKAFLGLLNNFDPHLVVDMHTTNGTWHGYRITYAPSYHTAGEESLFKYSWYDMIPTIVDNVLSEYDLHFGPYGWYSLSGGWPPKAISTYNHHPRYLVNSMGLRNRLGLLSETFAHDRFYHRIFAAYVFIDQIAAYTNAHATELLDLIYTAEKNTIEKVKTQAGVLKKGVRYQKEAMPELFTLRTYDYLPMINEKGDTTYVRTGNIVNYEGVKNYSSFKPIVMATLPKGYIIPAQFENIVDHLKLHGAKVEQFKKAGKADAEVFTVTELKKASREFEGHLMAEASGEYHKKEYSYKKGDYYVSLEQPLANLIFYMLEPQSDDGLVNWNFFDNYFSMMGMDEGSATPYPIVKYYGLN